MVDEEVTVVARRRRRARLDSDARWSLIGFALGAFLLGACLVESCEHAHFPHRTLTLGVTGTR